MPMRDMSREEAHAFLMAGTRTGHLATLRSDGRPHVVPIWFVLRDGLVVFNTSGESVKAANMRHEPMVAMSVDDPTPPYSFVTIEGTVTLTADDPELLEIATEIGRRYMGPGLAREFGERNAAPGELVVRLSMDTVISGRDVAD